MYYVGHGSSHIGLGHLYRLLALAQRWQDSQAVLLTHSVQSAQQVWAGYGSITELEDPVHSLTQHVEPGAIVVLDDYTLGPNIERRLQQAGAIVIRLDDEARQPIHADIVLNHAASYDSYHGRLALHSRACLGPRYAVLRPAFMNPDLAQLAPDSPATLTLCLGGADPGNLVQQCLGSLAAQTDYRLRVILGAAYLHHAALQAFAASLPQPIEICSHLTAEAMAHTLRTSTVVIASASTLAMEVCSLQVPCIAIAYADNQRQLADYLARQQLAHVCGTDAIPRLPAIVAALDARTRQSMQQHQRAAFGDGSDLEAVGHYARRLASLTLRAAVSDDSDTLYRWANEPAVRQLSLNPEPIARATHEQWMANSLSSPTRRLYIAQCQGQAIGYVRFDAVTQVGHTHHVVSLALDAAWRGRALAQPMLRLAIRQFAAAQPDTDLQLRALVHPENRASQQLFRQAGFRAAGSVDVQGREFHSYEK